MSEVTNMNNQFLRDIWGIIDTARAQAVRSVDFCRVQMYWHMGKRIFEEEQQGKDRGSPIVSWLFAVNFIGFIRL